MRHFFGVILFQPSDGKQIKGQREDKNDNIFFLKVRSDFLFPVNNVLMLFKIAPLIQ
jgi:hypothetical protein